jgi:DNA modification methylase
MRDLIRTYTNQGDLILDFALGSGTTLLAAKLEGRRAIGIEILKEYCDVAVERLKEDSDEAY